jgi:hypothetical protein
MVGDFKARFLSYPAIDLSVYQLIHIKNAATFLTPEVIVALGIAIEPAYGARKVQLQDLPLPFQ